MPSHTLRAALALTLPCLVFSATAATHYTYTSPEIGANSIALFAPTDRVTGVITLAAPAFSGNHTGATVLDFDFQLGGFHLSKAGGADLSLSVTVDGSGSFASWSFVVGDYSGLWGSPALVEIWGNSSDLAPGQTRVIAAFQGSHVLAAVTAPGAWALSSTVPEPGSTALLLLGGLILAAWRATGVRTHSLRHQLNLQAAAHRLRIFAQRGQ